MRVTCHSTFDELAPLAPRWDLLAAGVPFRAWAWAECWWRHYGVGRPARRLMVACVYDTADTLVAVAPWFLERSAACGRVLQFLGTGEVCSEYLSVLCEKGRVEPAMEALAGWLCRPCGGQRNAPAGVSGWDLLRLAGVEKHDPVVTRLVSEMVARGNLVDCRPGPACWQIELPNTWDGFLAVLSKSHRKQVRRLEHRLLDRGRAALHTARCVGDLPTGFQQLVDLHQRRQESLGLRGCFASAPFTAFHRDVLTPMFTGGQLQLHWMELDGRPVAAEYHLSGDGIVYAYQGGIAPEALHAEPGRLITLATLRQALALGYRGFDFLRGDEPYKAHWRAAPRATLDVRIVPDRVAARLRHQFWVTGREVRRWIRTGLGSRRPAAGRAAARFVPHDPSTDTPPREAREPSAAAPRPESLVTDHSSLNART